MRRVGFGEAGGGGVVRADRDGRSVIGARDRHGDILSAGRVGEVARGVLNRERVGDRDGFARGEVLGQRVIDCKGPADRVGLTSEGTGVTRQRQGRRRAEGGLEGGGNRGTRAGGDGLERGRRIERVGEI